MDEQYDEVPEVEPGPPVARGTALPEGIAPAVEALPGLARVAASAWWHTTEWGVRTSARAGRRMARAVADPTEAATRASPGSASTAGAIDPGRCGPPVVGRRGRSCSISGTSS